MQELRANRSKDDALKTSLVAHSVMLSGCGSLLSSSGISSVPLFSLVRCAIDFLLEKTGKYKHGAVHLKLSRAIEFDLSDDCSLLDEELI